jgi:hypothetical protein
MYIQRSDTLPWGSGLTVDTLEHIVFSGHVVVLELSTWWDRVLFTTRLEIAARAPCLHTVGTVPSYCSKGYPYFRYRQWPRAHLWG